MPQKNIQRLGGNQHQNRLTSHRQDENVVSSVIHTDMQSENFQPEALEKISSQNLNTLKCSISGSMGVYDQQIAQSMGPVSHQRVSGVNIAVNNLGTRSSVFDKNDDLTPV